MTFCGLLLGFDGHERRPALLLGQGRTAVPLATPQPAELLLRVVVGVGDDRPLGQCFGLLGGLDQDGAIQGGHAISNPRAAVRMARNAFWSMPSIFLDVRSM